MREPVRVGDAVLLKRRPAPPRRRHLMATRIALLKDGALDLLLPRAEFREARTPEARGFLAGLEER